MAKHDMEARVKIASKDLTGPGIKSATAKLQGLGKTLSSVGKKMSLFVTAPLAILGGVALKTAADFEKQQVAFETMLGSAEKAKILLKDIIDFSAKTPFQLPGLQTAASRLLGFGIEADKVVQTLRNLGNAAMGDQDRLDRLTLAFGKLKAKGKATLEELNMFLEAGVPILDELSSMYDTTTQEMFKMISEGKIGFTDVNQALINLTTGTGKYAGMVEEQAKTLSGLLSTLKDNFSLLGMEIMQTVMPQIKAFSEKLLGLVQRLREMDPRTKKIILLVATLAAALGPLLIVVGSAIRLMAVLRTAFIALNAVMVANPILAIVTAVALLVTAGIILYRNWDKVCGFLKLLWEDLKKVGVIVFESLRLAVLTYVKGYLIAITAVGRVLGKVFGFEVKKLEGALAAVNRELANSVAKIKETAAGTWSLADRIKELRKDEDELAKAQADANAALAGLSGPARENKKALDDLTEAEEELLHNINHTSERLHAADNAMWEASQSTDKYANAMQRLEDRARLLQQPLAEITNQTELMQEAALEAANVMEGQWARSWEIMGDSAMSAAEKIKQVIGGLLADMMRMIGKKLLVLAMEAFVPGWTFNPAAGVGYLAASAAAYAAAGFIQSLGQGGIVTRPTLALVGESGLEAVIPLGKGGGIGTTINVHVYGSVQTEKDLAQTIAREIGRQGYSVT